LRRTLGGHVSREIPPSPAGVLHVRPRVISGRIVLLLTDQSDVLGTRAPVRVAAESEFHLLTRAQVFAGRECYGVRPHEYIFAKSWA
jgi:hypothetical protein